MPWYWPFSSTQSTHVSEIDKLQYVIDLMQDNFRETMRNNLPLQEGVFRIPGNQTNIALYLNAIDRASTKTDISLSFTDTPSINDLSGIIKILLDRIITDQSIKFNKDMSAIQKLMHTVYKNPVRLKNPTQRAEDQEKFDTHMSNILNRTPTLRSLFDIFILLENHSATKMDAKNIGTIFTPKFRALFSGKRLKESLKNSEMKKEHEKNIRFEEFLQSFLEKDFKPNKDLPHEQIKNKKTVRFLDEQPPPLQKKHVLYIVVQELTKNTDGSLRDEKNLLDTFVIKIKSAIEKNQKIIIDLTEYSGSISNLLGSLQLEAMKGKIPTSLNFKIIATDNKFLEMPYTHLFNFLENPEAQNLPINNHQETKFILLKKYFTGEITIEHPPLPKKSPKL